jgi:tetratricopeptide (TPR) repeat protein
MFNLKFPQISRLFSAGIFTAVLYWLEKTLLWSALGIFLYINIVTLSKANNPKDIFLPALTQPFSATNHTKIASELWRIGLHAQAKHELTLAQDLPGNTAVLGAETSPSILLDRWESQPKTLEANYLFWKEVLEKKPNYRDAFIQAGVFAYEMGNIDTARNLLEQAQTLDPNFHFTTTILSQVRP